MPTPDDGLVDEHVPRVLDELETAARRALDRLVADLDGDERRRDDHSDGGPGDQDRRLSLSAATMLTASTAMTSATMLDWEYVKYRAVQSRAITATASGRLTRASQRAMTSTTIPAASSRPYTLESAKSEVVRK